MLRIIEYFILIAIFSINGLLTQSAQPETSAESCINPKGLVGQCKSIQYCPSLMALLNSQNRTFASLKFLRDSACSAKTNTDQKLCCVDQLSSDNGTDSNAIVNPRSSLLPEDCGNDIFSENVNQAKANLTTHPWTVLLKYQTPNGTNLACGGVLISKRYVLTAAHCVTQEDLPDSSELVGVRLGEYNMNGNPDCFLHWQWGDFCGDSIVKVGVEKIITHEQYVSNELHPVNFIDYSKVLNSSNSSEYRVNDIALIRLTRDVKFTEYIKPICLPKTADIPEEMVVAGWGIRNFGRPSIAKRWALIPPALKGLCEFVWPLHKVSIDKSSQICAGELGKQDVCRGDSGGPLMALQPDNNGTKRWTAIGLLSIEAHSCESTGLPLVYTKISSFTDWIVDKMEP